MMSIRLEEWPARLEAARRGMPIKIEGVFKAAALRAERSAKTRAGVAPKVRSGRLRRSIVGEAIRRTGETDISLRAGGDGTGKGEVRYARIQEKGGIVRPRNTQFLAIPVGPARTASGVAKYSSPRDIPGLVLVQSRKGQLLLVMPERGQVGGKGKHHGAGTVFFILKRQVRIAAQPYLRPAMDELVLLLPSEVLGAVTEVLRGQ